MKIELKEIDSFPAELSLRAEPAELDFELDEVRLSDGVAVDVSLQRTEDEYFVNGEVTAVAETDCARCLEPALLELHCQLSLIALRPTAEDRDKYRDSDEEIVELGTEEVLELDDQIRQGLLAEIPLKPLCREDCKGLCPVCGANKNISECDCDTSERDSRWDALKDFAD